jgi:hypothetical protein
MDKLIEKANRLAEITQRMGFALWQIQELEGCTARYLVLVTQAKRGMGTKACDELLGKAFGKTLGATIHKVTKTGLLSIDLERRFCALLTERNWLVHKLRAQSRNAIHSKPIAEKIIQRLDAMADESKALLYEIAALAEQYVKKIGISQQQIEEAANHLLEQWHDPNVI